MMPTLSDPMAPSPFRVNRVRKETYDTFTFELFPSNGIDGFSFAPGQFNMVYVSGVGEVPISISGDPGRPEALVHTVRSVGTVTEKMCARGPGALLGVRGPFGTSWPVEEAIGSDVVIVCGGIGVAPLRPALYQVMANREKYGRVALLYGARTPEDLLYKAELPQGRGRFDLQVEVTVDAASGNWRGNVGVVTTLIPPARFDPEHTVAMVCGPEVMMRFTLVELERRGVPAENTYVSLEGHV